jgi:hypothetical protein
MCAFIYSCLTKAWLHGWIGDDVVITRCLGHIFGTGCMKTRGGSSDAPNWVKWQLCYECAKILQPEFYENKRNHGVGSNKMNVRMADDMTVMPMIEQ